MYDNETSFKKLMRETQQGDSVSYRELMLSLSGFLKNYLRRRIFEKNDIEEVIQEVLLALHKSKHTYDLEKPFMGWFMSVVEYKITDYIRAKQKQNAHLGLESIAEVFQAAQIDSDLKLDIETALQNLSHKEKAVITELKIKGYSVSEVASSLNLSEANVKVIAHRAYNQLKKQLGELS